MEISAAPLRDANSVITHVVCLASDISDRKRAEEALRDSETRNRVIAEMVSDYAYIYGVTPEGELVGEWVTESFTKRFGYPKAKVHAWGAGRAWYCLKIYKSYAHMRRRWLVVKWTFARCAG